MDDFKHIPQAERRLRRMLCIAMAKGSPYMDDGEAQDNSMFPCIDFMRDSPEQIHSKLMERAIAKHKAQQEQRINVPVAHELAKEQAKTDQSVTPEYLAWLESLYPARNGVGGNEAWNAGIAWFKAQQEQPASVDAYVGAREDAAIWKKRALEAEELNRKFIADVNGPTYLGEPVKQEQPAQEPVAWEGAEGWEQLAWHLCAEENGEEACTELIWEGGPIPEPWGDRWLKYEHEAKQMIATVKKFAAPTRPAMSDDDFYRIIRPFYGTDEACKMALPLSIDEFRAIEAHCRGGANG